MLTKQLKLVNVENQDDLDKLKIVNQKLDFLLKLQKSGLIETPSENSI